MGAVNEIFGRRWKSKSVNAVKREVITIKVWSYKYNGENMNAKKGTRETYEMAQNTIVWPHIGRNQEAR
jgi:hypothetical protein